MGIVLFCVGLIFFMLFIVASDIIFMYFTAICWGLTAIMLLISNYVSQKISVSVKHIPITNPDDFFITSDNTGSYVCFGDGCGKYYVIPKEKVLIKTLSDDEANSICVDFIELTISNSNAKDILSDFGLAVFSRKSAEYYYFLIPESAKKLQEVTEPSE